MDIIAQVLYYGGNVGSIVCFVLVLVQMFQHNQTTLGIFCIVCCPIGGLTAFVFGWINNKEWDILRVMIIWTVCVIVSLIGGASVGFPRP
jgi:hypothetical protein